MDWQPIETAPKDGTEVLAVHYREWEWQGAPTVYGPFTAAFRDGEWMASWDDAPVIEAESWAGTTYERCPIGPTHWMPLPPPPRPEHQDTHHKSAPQEGKV